MVVGVTVVVVIVVVDDDVVVVVACVVDVVVGPAGQCALLGPSAGIDVPVQQPCGDWHSASE